VKGRAMILFIDGRFECELQQPGDFRRFSVTIAAPRNFFGELSSKLSNILQFDGETTAWVSADALRALGPADNPAWNGDFDQMVEAARPKWVRDNPSLAIRAHIVWLESDQDSDFR
jgi:hypothetical protein